MRPEIVRYLRLNALRFDTHRFMQRHRIWWTPEGWRR